MDFTTINSNFGSIGYTATVAIPIIGDSARIQLTIGSFQVSDNNTLFGCHARFDGNGSSTEALESGSASLAGEINYGYYTNFFICIPVQISS